MAIRGGRVTGSRRTKAYRAEVVKLRERQRRADERARARGFRDSLVERRTRGTKAYRGYSDRVRRALAGRKMSDGDRRIITRYFYSAQKRRGRRMTQLQRDARGLEWLKLLGVLSDDATVEDYRNYAGKAA